MTQERIDTIAKSLRQLPDDDFEKLQQWIDDRLQSSSQSAHEADIGAWFLKHAEQNKGHLPEDYQFDRDEIYER